MSQLESLYDELYDDTFITTEAEQADADREAELKRLQEEREAKEKAEKAEQEKRKKELLKKIAKCLLVIAAGIAAVLVVKKLIADYKEKKHEADKKFLEDCTKAIGELESKLKANDKILKNFEKKIKSGKMTNSEYDRIMDIIDESTAVANQAIKMKRTFNSKMGGDTADEINIGTERYAKKIKDLKDQAKVVDKNYKADVHWFNRKKVSQRTLDHWDKEQEAKSRKKAADVEEYWRNRSELKRNAQGKGLKEQIKAQVKAELQAHKDYRKARNINASALDAEVDFMLNRGYADLLSESEQAYLDVCMEHACTLIYDLATETYETITESINEAYVNGNITAYQYNELREAALEGYYTYE